MDSSVEFKKSIEDIDFLNIEDAELSLCNVYLENGLATYNAVQNRFRFVREAKENAKREKMRILLEMSAELYGFVRRYCHEPDISIKRACVSRAYYSLFFAARALVVWKRERDPGVGQNVHAAVARAIEALRGEGRHCQELAKILRTMRDQRVQADYRFYLSDRFRRTAGTGSLGRLNQALTLISRILRGADYHGRVDFHRPD